MESHNNNLARQSNNANANAKQNSNDRTDWNSYRAPVVNTIPSGAQPHAPVPSHADRPHPLTLQNALNRANQGRKRRYLDDDDENVEAQLPKRLRLQEETPAGTAFNHWGRMNEDLFPRADFPPRVEDVPATYPVHYVSPEYLEIAPFINGDIGRRCVARHQLTLINIANASNLRRPDVNLRDHRRQMAYLLQEDLNPAWWVRLETQMRAWGWEPADEEVNDAGLMMEEILRGRQEDESDETPQ